MRESAKNLTLQEGLRRKIAETTKGGSLPFR
jgi:hypothetical protein